MTKLENFEVSAYVASTDTTEKNVVRMRRFWQDGNNAVLYSIGRILAPLAAGLLNREEFDLGETFRVKETGAKLPLAPGQVISLQNVAQWGCPACGSAHGTCVGPSPKQSHADRVRGLSANQFFYNPVTRRVFTISKTCFAQYVKKEGQAGRIRDAATFPTETAKVETAKVETAKVATKK